MDQAIDQSQQVTDCTQVPEGCRLLILQHMDHATRAAWRMSCLLARRDVILATCTLTWRRTVAQRLQDITWRMDVTPYPSPAMLPTLLMADLANLRHLGCRGLINLTSIQGIPSTLHTLDLSDCDSLTSLLPLQHCTALEQLTLTACRHEFERLALTLPPVMTAVSSTLTHLTLKVRQAPTAAAAEAVLQSLAPLTHLQQLSLQLELSSEEQWHTFARCISLMPGLRALDLCDMRLQDADMIALAPAVRQLQQLQSLSLINYRMDREAETAMSDAIASLPATLTRLHWGAVGSRLADAAALVQALQTHAATLRVLTLPSTPLLYLEDVETFTGGLRCCSALTILELKMCNLTASAAVQLASALSDSGAPLTSLNLCMNPLGDRGAAALVKALSPMTSLVDLDLSAIFLSPCGAELLAPALSSLAPSLTSLSIGANPLGAEGVALVAPALGSMSRLLNLDCGEIQLDPEAAAVLAATLLPIAPSLTCLDLSDNPLGDDGIATLAPALRCMAALTKLVCWNTRFGPTGAAELASALPAMVQMRFLDLNGNPLEFTGLWTLGGGLQTLSARQHWVIAMHQPPGKDKTGLEELAPVVKGLECIASWEVCRSPNSWDEKDDDGVSVFGLQVTL